MASEDYSSMMYVPEVKPEADEENVDVCESSDPPVHHGCDNTVRICLAHQVVVRMSRLSERLLSIFCNCSEVFSTSDSKIR